jgi:hypothetical protein
MPAGSTALAAAVLGASLVASSPEPLLRIQDPALLESSGLAASVRHPGVLWTHADGGTVAQVRAVDGGGATVATVTVAGIDPWDPEAMAISSSSGEPEIYLGDIGDNQAERDDVSVFRFAEPPSLTDQSVEVLWYRFTYPDGPHDAEALLVHPRTGRIYIATKSFGQGGLYRAPREPVTVDNGSNELERVGAVPPLVTDGVFLPDGRFALRTYSSVHVYDRPGEEVASAALPAQPQGESIAVRDGELLVGSEGERSAVYAVPVPSAPEFEPTPTRAADRSPTRADGQAWRDAYRVARAVAIVVVLVGIVVALRRSHTRRRR